MTYLSYNEAVSDEMAFETRGQLENSIGKNLVCDAWHLTNFEHRADILQCATNLILLSNEPHLGSAMQKSEAMIAIQRRIPVYVAIPPPDGFFFPVQFKQVTETVEFTTRIGKTTYGCKFIFDDKNIVPVHIESPKLVSLFKNIAPVKLEGEIEPRDFVSFKTNDRKPRGGLTFRVWGYVLSVYHTTVDVFVIKSVAGGYIYEPFTVLNIPKLNIMAKYYPLVPKIT